jgi:predicted lipoprotein with Yx(FWY)xxD motif
LKLEFLIGSRRIPMMPTRFMPTTVLAVAAAATLGLAACSPYSSSAPGDSSGSASAGSVATRQIGGLGTILTSVDGHVFYVFELEQSGQVACSDACLASWPAVPAGPAAPSLGAGIDPGLIGRVDGSAGAQLTYNRWPLHTFVGDTTPGDASGHGLVADGGRWSAITVHGTAAGAP